MKKACIFATLMAMAVANMAAQNNDETQRMLDRFLSYVRIESQSTYPDDPEKEWPLNEGQKEIADLVYNEIKSIGYGIEVSISPDHYVYAKVPSNMKEHVPSICFMAHLDVSPECNGIGITPQVIRNYQGGDIALGNSGLILSPNTIQGAHLKDVIGHCLVTTSGNTLLGGDDKCGVAILVSLLEKIAYDEHFEHPDVWCVFTQNEDVGLVAYRMDTSYFTGGVPDIMIDVDGGEVGHYSVANFYAVGRTYLFKGNLRHPAFGATNGLVDAQTALAYYIGQLPVEINPMFSSGKQGYMQAYIIDNLQNGDFRVKFRIRYFEREDSIRFAQYLKEAEEKTLEAFPGLEIIMEANYLQYSNVYDALHPLTLPAIERAMEKTGLRHTPNEIRAGSTGGMLVAKGLPGSPILYAAQQCEHSTFEWCSINEMVEITKLCKQIISEVIAMQHSEANQR
jgi:tripeptide aminopeptidase